MDNKKLTTCRSCGARLPEETEKCALCGWPVGQDDHDAQKSVEASGEMSAGQEDSEASGGAEQPLEATGDGGPFCHMCGWHNPPGARFCSACGTELQVVTKKVVTEKVVTEKVVTEKKASVKKAKLPPVSSDESAKPDVLEAGQEEAQTLKPLHLGMLTIAGLLIVAALYMITAFSRRAFPEVEPAQAAETQQAESTSPIAPGGELPEDVASRVAAIESESEGLQGEALVLKKREIVSILSSINRPDRAAPVQEEVAELSGSSDDWFQAGHLFYDWMDVRSGEERYNVALRAVNAYEKGLEIAPDDLNIRTALAMAYLNTRAPMQGVQQIRQVLETDPDHLQGNFYYGVMLMQINRLDQAQVQFERVKELTGPESPLYQQSEMMLNNLSGLN